VVVGLGPGKRDLLTPRALKAIQEADLIIAYKTYLPFFEDLIIEQEVISSGMRKEMERAQAAVDEASKGKNVVVVSSGDPGVYGMAGLVLQTAGEIPVEIVPGVTAATTAAALLGAPLMHDFAVISLSDLLTPWAAIQLRLEAAAQADFIVVLYNPRSKGRPNQMETARQILLRHKEELTPVGIVRAAERGQETVLITTLRDMPMEVIDMQTTVIVGNSQTIADNGRMITPRGYLL